ncbi:hypothetical protein D3C76_450530 [compost metagenome]
MIGQRVGVAGVLAAAVGDADLLPAHARVAQGLAHGIGALRLSTHAVGAAEGMQADTDDRYVFHDQASPAGANAKVCNVVPSGLRP